MFYNFSCYINVVFGNSLYNRCNRSYYNTHGICASKVISKIMEQQSLLHSWKCQMPWSPAWRIYANAWHYDGNDPCPLVISLQWAESSRGWWDSRHAYILAEDNPMQTTFPSHLSWWEHLTCQTHKSDRMRLLKGKFINLLIYGHSDTFRIIGS